MRSLLLLLAVAALAAAERLAVITGSPVVHDITRHIGGERIDAHCLIAPGVDPHSYQPRPEDARALAAAAVVVVNGLGFEGWFEPLMREGGWQGRVVVAAAGVTPLTLAKPAGDGGGHDSHHHGSTADPHAFGDLANGVRYAEAIRDGLSAADPAGADEYRARTELYVGQIRAVDGWVKRQVARIPPERRKVVTNHDAMRYFARAYGFDVRAPNTALDDAQPGARTVAELVAFIRAQGVRTVFIEYAKNPKLVEGIAAEAGVAVGAPLFLDTTPPDDGADTGYLGMFVRNTTALVRGLQ